MKETLSLVLREKASHEIVSVQPTCSVIDCIKQMNEKKIGAMLVMENNQLVGMFTERDVLKKLFDSPLNLETTPVSAVMTKNLLHAHPDTTVEEALSTFTERRFRHLPVVDQHDKLLGIVSIGDLTKWLITHQQHEIQHLADYIGGRHTGEQP